MLRAECFCIWGLLSITFVDIFAFSISVCVVFFQGLCCTAIFRMLLLYPHIYMGIFWFWWFTFSVIGSFTSIADVDDFSIFVHITGVSAYCFCTLLYPKKFYIIWCHFFTLNHYDLTVFSMLVFWFLWHSIWSGIFWGVLFFVSSKYFNIWTFYYIDCSIILYCIFSKSFTY